MLGIIFEYGASITPREHSQASTTATKQSPVMFKADLTSNEFR